MGRNDAYEAYGAAEGRNRTCQKGAAEHNPKPKPFEFESGQGSELITEQDQVQPLARKQGSYKADQESDAHDGQTSASHAPETTGHPAVEQFQTLFRCRILQYRRQGAEHEAQHDAGQKQGPGGMSTR